MVTSYTDVVSDGELPKSCYILHLFIMQRICNFSFVLQSLPDFEMEVVIAS